MFKLYFSSEFKDEAWCGNLNLIYLNLSFLLFYPVKTKIIPLRLTFRGKLILDSNPVVFRFCGSGWCIRSVQQRNGTISQESSKDRGPPADTKSCHHQKKCPGVSWDEDWWWYWQQWGRYSHLHCKHSSARLHREIKTTQGIMLALLGSEITLSLCNFVYSNLIYSMWHFKWCYC